MIAPQHPRPWHTREVAADCPEVGIAGGSADGDYACIIDANDNIVLALDLCPGPESREQRLELLELIVGAVNRAG
jgi:hypothetical protein